MWRHCCLQCWETDYQVSTGNVLGFTNTRKVCSDKLEIQVNRKHLYNVCAILSKIQKQLFIWWLWAGKAVEGSKKVMTVCVPLSHVTSRKCASLSRTYVCLCLKKKWEYTKMLPSWFPKHFKQELSVVLQSIWRWFKKSGVIFLLKMWDLLSVWQNISYWIFLLTKTRTEKLCGDHL